MKLEAQEVADGIRIVVEGDVDMESSPKLRDQIKKSLKSKPQRLSMKMTDVPYIDSSGIAVLIEGMKWSKKKGSEYALVAISDNVRSVLELSKLLAVFTVEEG
ncbi:MAG: STAS domain-containing protein [Planctomycetota bacterium]